MSGRYTVYLTDGAETDLAEIHGWIAANRSPEQAEAFLEAMLAKVDSLEAFPDRGSVPVELDALGIREFRQLVAPPYRLIYRVIVDHVFVFLIADGRRDFQALLERRLLSA
ncbi:type II toxin-antitoxin system RelE/ParE family toxin [Sphingomonas sp. ABOLE]|uniref:type II toxin-antitoxin system RelE/ParE family toxin n=1 Tax=Sphingomonas sp. ABOLE TaxID=1985878 RepID=UPI000F7EE67F|nr:type II toxin-antitoxin system RelE/ParE family toxin [Sphingomonas sp. ABOLE]RSV39614.1 type II toxin-antitoxin system RelE/ParE family toxin [Sphingomonas sp. ABOLE]